MQALLEIEKYKDLRHVGICDRHKSPIEPAGRATTTLAATRIRVHAIGSRSNPTGWPTSEQQRSHDER